MTTKLQAKMLKLIAENEMNAVNGGVPQSPDDIGQIWASCVIFSAEDKGVATSLINAGMVKHFGTGDMAYFDLTEAGFAEYLCTRNQVGHCGYGMNKQEAIADCEYQNGDGE